MKGFNYTTGADFDLPVAQLREELQGIVTSGGFRRVENGETFAHGSDGVIIWEAYGNISLDSSAIKRRPTLLLFDEPSQQQADEP